MSEANSGSSLSSANGGKSDDRSHCSSQDSHLCESDGTPLMPKTYISTDLDLTVPVTDEISDAGNELNVLHSLSSTEDKPDISQYKLKRKTGSPSFNVEHSQDSCNACPDVSSPWKKTKCESDELHNHESDSVFKNVKQSCDISEEISEKAQPTLTKLISPNKTKFFQEQKSSAGGFVTLNNGSKQETAFQIDRIFTISGGIPDEKITLAGHIYTGFPLDSFGQGRNLKVSNRESLPQDAENLSLSLPEDQAYYLGPSLPEAQYLKPSLAEDGHQLLNQLLLEDYNQNLNPSLHRAQCLKPVLPKDSYQHLNPSLPNDDYEHQIPSLPEAKHLNPALPEESNQHLNSLLPKDDYEYQNPSQPEVKHLKPELPEDSYQHLNPSLPNNDYEHQIPASPEESNEHLNSLLSKDNYEYQNPSQPEVKHLKPELPEDSYQRLNPSLTEDNKHLKPSLPEDDYEYLNVSPPQAKHLNPAIAEDNYQYLNPLPVKEDYELVTPEAKHLNPELPEDNHQNLNPSLPKNNNQRLNPSLPEDNYEYMNSSLPEATLLNPGLPIDTNQHLNPLLHKNYYEQLNPSLPEAKHLNPVLPEDSNLHLNTSIPEDNKHYLNPSLFGSKNQHMNPSLPEDAKLKSETYQQQFKSIALTFAHNSKPSTEITQHMKSSILPEITKKSEFSMSPEVTNTTKSSALPKKIDRTISSPPPEITTNPDLTTRPQMTNNTKSSTTSHTEGSAAESLTNSKELQENDAQLQCNRPISGLVLSLEQRTQVAKKIPEPILDQVDSSVQVINQIYKSTTPTPTTKIHETTCCAANISSNYLFPEKICDHLDKSESSFDQSLVKLSEKQLKNIARHSNKVEHSDGLLFRKSVSSKSGHQKSIHEPESKENCSVVFDSVCYNIGKRQETIFDIKKYDCEYIEMPTSPQVLISMDGASYSLTSADTDMAMFGEPSQQNMALDNDVPDISANKSNAFHNYCDENEHSMPEQSHDIRQSVKITASLSPSQRDNSSDQVCPEQLESTHDRGIHNTEGLNLASAPRGGEKMTVEATQGDHCVPRVETQLNDEIYQEHASLYNIPNDHKQGCVETLKVKQAFQWNSVYETFMNKVLPEETTVDVALQGLSSIQPIIQSHRPIRLGLSRKQKVQNLHHKNLQE